MCTKEQFLSFIHNIKSFRLKITGLCCLNIDMTEAFPQIDKLEELFVQSHLTEAGQDWYWWYMYEKPENSDGGNVWEKDGTVIDMATESDLWDYLVKWGYVL